MPVNLSPGAYVEEFEIGVDPVNVATTNLFTSPYQSESGLSSLIPITEFEEYKRAFADDTSNPYLIYGVEDFFKNGGKRCFAFRSVRTYGSNTRDSIAWNLGACPSQVVLNKDEDAILNPKGANVMPLFTGKGILIWGARTVSTDTQWKYVKVRRLFIFIEESLEKGTKWLVFEPNNERLWSGCATTITKFLTRAWADGMLVGNTSEQSFFVKCDRTTMTQDDIDNGRLTVFIGFAPIKPAEFIVVKITQTKGDAVIDKP